MRLPSLWTSQTKTDRAHPTLGGQWSVWRSCVWRAGLPGSSGLQSGVDSSSRHFVLGRECCLAFSCSTASFDRLACELGISVSKLAQEHGISANMLFKWRRDLRAGLLTAPSADAAQLLPVVLKRPTVSPARPVNAAPAGTIEIAIADAVVRVGANADAALLRLVLQSLRA
jgi:transposase